MLHAVERHGLHIIIAPVKPDIYSPVAIAGESGEEGYPALGPRSEILRPQAAISALIIDGRARILPIVPDESRGDRTGQRRAPLHGPPVVAGLRSCFLRREYRHPAGIPPFISGAATGHRRMPGILLMPGQRMTICVISMDKFGGPHPGIVRDIEYAVEIVVYFLAKGPQYRESAETCHPVTGQGLQCRSVRTHKGTHRTGEEELRIGMDQTGSCYVLVIPVSGTESGDILGVDLAVRQVEAGSDRFTLIYCKTLCDTPVDYVFEMGSCSCVPSIGAGSIEFFRVHPPVRVAKIEKRGAVSIGQVLPSRFGLQEAMPVYLKVSFILLAAESPFKAVKRHVLLTGRLPFPFSGTSRGETDQENVPAVPESRTDQGLAAPLMSKNDIHHHGVRPSG